MGLMEAILCRDNMMAALRRVVANKGAPGVDRMPVARLGDHLKAHWPRIRADLLAGRYRYAVPVRQARALPAASFRPRLATTPLLFG